MRYDVYKAIGSGLSSSFQEGVEKVAREELLLDREADVSSYSSPSLFFFAPRKCPMMTVRMELPLIIIHDPAILPPKSPQKSEGSRSVESTSAGTPSQEGHVGTLAWDISYVVKEPQGRKKKMGGRKPVRTILHSVVGQAESGDLVAVMGASGCGKSTFLSCLALRDQAFRGNVYMNDAPVDKWYLSLVGFVDQHDIFYPTMTVREHLTYHAMVRLGSSVRHRTKMARVQEVLLDLNLGTVADSCIGGGKSMIRGLSHGERKRLSFATEMLPDPHIVIADEPTTGLDASMARSVCRTLRNMADTGRIVICSIHQPSSQSFMTFTHVLLVANGRIGYYGRVEHFTDYLRNLGLHCPAYYNIADFAVNCFAIPPDERQAATDRVIQLCRRYETSELAATNQACRNRMMSGHLPTNKRKVFVREYRANAWTQFRHSLIRQLKAEYRDTKLTAARFGVAVGTGAIIGLAYRTSPKAEMNQALIDDILGLFMTVSIFLMVTNFFMVAFALPSELHVFLRERISGVNRTGSYFSAHLVAQIPFLLLWSALYAFVCFPLALPTLGPVQLMSFLGTIVLSNITSVTLGYLISVAAMDDHVALALVPVLSMPSALFAGLFVSLESVPIFLRWLHHLSIVKYTFHALAIQYFRGMDTIHCSTNNCTYPTWRSVLAKCDADKLSLRGNLFALMGMAVALILLGYAVLIRKTKRVAVR